jgi:hypothetical protein
MIRETARAEGVKLWRIADALGMADGTFSRKLRRELPEAEQRKIMGIIEMLAKEEEQ